MRVDVGSDAARSANNGNGRDGVVILKFGSAAFDGGDVAAVASEIYQRARDGKKVAVVVPLGAARAGEQEFAAQLAAQCKLVGLDADVLSDAAGANRSKVLHNAFARRDVAIIPDIVAADEGGRQASPQRLRVAVAGLGLIGEGVALRLGGANPDYDFCAALVREPFKERTALSVAQVTNDMAAFLAAKPDIVIDALPDGKAGHSLIMAALARGIDIVTANKQAIAGSLANLTRLSNQTGATFSYSASVGGGAPFVETVGRARRLGEIRSIEAVLNGTVNFILSSIAGGGGFEEAVRAAQDAGFAEPDPSADLSGGDARAKLAILSFAAFGREIDLNEIEIEALDADKAARFAKEGGRWKQIARLRKDRDGMLSASVAFERCDDDPLFTAAMWEANALRICQVGGRIFECRGKGAGRRPTVESILGDLGAIRRMPEPAIPRNETLQENAVSA